MLERYKQPVNDVAKPVRIAVLKYFGLDFWIASPRIRLWGILRNRKISQADLILALLRINTTASLRAAESIIGKPITHCPPCLVLQNPTVAQRGLPEARVVSVAPNPRHPKSGAYHRYENFRRGLTISQLIIRGVTKRDIRGVIRRKWVTFDRKIVIKTRRKAS